MESDSEGSLGSAAVENLGSRLTVIGKSKVAFNCIDESMLVLLLKILCAKSIKHRVLHSVLELRKYGLLFFNS